MPAIQHVPIHYLAWLALIALRVPATRPAVELATRILVAGLLPQSIRNFLSEPFSIYHTGPLRLLRPLATISPHPFDVGLGLRGIRSGSRELSLVPSV